MQTAHSANGHSPRHAINGIGESLEKTIDQNRTLLSEIAEFTNRESMHFVERQFHNARFALAIFDYRRNLGSLIGAQQAWLNVMRDYTDQSERYGEMFRNLADRIHDPLRKSGSALMPAGTRGTRSRRSSKRATQ